MNEMKTIKRYGMAIGLRPEKIPYYNELHENPWPEVLAKLKECNIQNYSIYPLEVKPGEWVLFAYLEYTGDDFDADMAKIAADETTQKWWLETDPCQYILPTAKDGEKWNMLDEVFHLA